MPCSTAMGLKFLGFKMYWVLGFKLGLYWIAERVSLSLLSPQLILELCSSPVFTFPSQAHQPSQRAFRFFKDLGLGCIGTGLIYRELMFRPGPAGSSEVTFELQCTKCTGNKRNMESAWLATVRLLKARHLLSWQFFSLQVSKPSVVKFPETICRFGNFSVRET